MMQDFYSVLDRFGSLYPSKHSSWWRRTEDVLSVTFFCLQRRLEYILRTSSRHNFKASSWRRLQEDVFKTSSRRLGRRLEDVLKLCFEGILKTSWRRLAKTSWRRFWKTYCKHALKTSWRRQIVTLKTSSRRLTDVLENTKCLLGHRKVNFTQKWLAILDKALETFSRFGLVSLHDRVNVQDVSRLAEQLKT